MRQKNKCLYGAYFLIIIIVHFLAPKLKGTSNSSVKDQVIQEIIQKETTRQTIGETLIERDVFWTYNLKNSI